MSDAADKLASQFAYLKKLKRMALPKLRKHHKEVFRGTRYDVKLVKPHRALIEKRCFYLFCMKHYHYPKGSGPRVAFFKLARETLKKTYHPLPAKEEEELTRQEQYKATELFTKDNINLLSHTQVDKYLTTFGIYVEVSYRKKRKLLWELHRLPVNRLPTTLNETGKPVSPRAYGRMRMQNAMSLRDLILANPTMTYGEFTERYGDKMPMTSRASFKVTRSQLKKSGYNMPDLRGAAQSVTRKGETTERGRKLNGS